MAVDVEHGGPPPGTGVDAPDSGGPTPSPARRGWSPGRIVVVVAALVALGAVLLFTGGPDEEAPPDDPPGDATPPPGELQDGYVAFTDPETGITLRHPDAWFRLKRADQTQRLLLSAGGDSTVSVRVEPIDGVVDTPETLAQVQAATDRIAGRPGVQVVNRQAIEVNGMLGISYLSRFTEEASGTNVANAQYFLFKGRTMHVVLFQVAPEEDFERLAPEFDKILASFQGVPTAPSADPAPAEPPASE